MSTEQVVQGKITFYRDILSCEIEPAPHRRRPRPPALPRSSLPKARWRGALIRMSISCLRLRARARARARASRRAHSLLLLLMRTLPLVVCARNVRARSRPRIHVDVRAYALLEVDRAADPLVERFEIKTREKRVVLRREVIFVHLRIIRRRIA